MAVLLGSPYSRPIRALQWSRSGPAIGIGTYGRPAIIRKLFVLRCFDCWRRGRIPRWNPPCVRLETCDVGCLQAFGSAGNLEFNSLALIQRLVAVCLNRREVDENIFARLPLDEPITLAGIEPLHSSLFFHFFVLSLLMSYLRVSIASSRDAIRVFRFRLRPRHRRTNFAPTTLHERLSWVVEARTEPN